MEISKDLSKGDLLLTKGGFNEIKSTKELPAELVYDLEILHENHRYWSGNGISSHNTAKTFIAMSIVRHAIKMGYHPIYFDSEGAIDVEFTKRLGVDPSKVRLDVINTIEDFSHMAAQIVKHCDDVKAKGETPPKLMVVLDSLGNMTSNKERTDTVENNDKRDMTKQQAIRKLFRVNGIDFARLGIPFVIVAHTYACLFSDAKVEMNDGNFKNIDKIIKGELVKTLAGDKEVTDTFKYNVPNYIHLKFEDGYEIKCTDNHKLAVEGKNGKIIWKTADNLEEGDEIIKT
ncbi:MAG: hypothetical protein HC831_18495 [Chloroflexia bacterium]|nr:hypothetical protein [Chloroflexia bacterium]